jgi:hypothetical protein
MRWQWLWMRAFACCGRPGDCPLAVIVSGDLRLGRVYGGYYDDHSDFMSSGGALEDPGQR